MMTKIFVAGLVFAAISAPTFAVAADAAFYVAQDAKTHACMVTDKKPDGKMMMDAGTKAYASQANAQQAMTNLKACTAAPAMAAPAKAAAAPAKAPAMAAPAKAPAMAPAGAGFYVAQDAKTKKCMVSDKKPDGKMAMDVGTKMYETQGRAQQAMSMLNVCKS